MRVGVLRTDDAAQDYPAAAFSALVHESGQGMPFAPLTWP